MKFKYLGTAAAEGIPAIFCNCDTCKKARELGGRNIRTRSQSIIDGSLLIDLPADSYYHMIANNLNFADVGAILISHIHGDHFYPNELEMHKKGFAYGCKPLTVCGSQDLLVPFTEKVDVHQLWDSEESDNRVKLKVVRDFEQFEILGYKITPIPAVHGTNNPFIYAIEKDGKTILYAHDTDVLPERTIEKIKELGLKFDFISMDCTEGSKILRYVGHMCIDRNVRFRDAFLAAGLADKSTVFAINHFSHNGLNACYDEMLPVANENGFVLSYDGMEIEI